MTGFVLQGHIWDIILIILLFLFSLYTGNKTFTIASIQVYIYPTIIKRISK